MESTIKAMSSAYEDFAAAAASVVREREASGGRRTAATDVALENFRQRWELFRASCDRAEEVMDMARRRITTESVVDAAASAAERPAEAGLTPVSVPRLEQALHAVNSLAADLRRGPGGAAVSSPPSSPSGVTSQAEKAD
ncbi:mediator of RNA polymerase II transcription subunit 32-like [Musa acuminata AAA Group]|uniref:mediator of RNA polymerase II transcription subunit 32-like n=1 Tax=Musa acuminata AAA Group TaxID=214697 RepID=UPI0031D09B7D